MAKVIKNFDIDLSDLPATSSSRRFSLRGDVGAIFSLEIKNEDNYYYNFKTGTFGATKAKLKRQSIPEGGIFSSAITFPTITDNDQYDIYLFAESHFDTVHANHEEVRFEDGSLDINSSRGSNSNLLQKVIYQYTDTTITIQSLSPMATHRSSGSFASMSVSSDSIVIGRGNNISKRSFSTSLTTAATKACQIIRQPTLNDFFVSVSCPFTSVVGVHGEDIWLNIGTAAAPARSTDTVDGDFSGGTTKIVMDSNVADKMKAGDRVTGTGIASTSAVTVVALNPDSDNVKEFSVSESVEINDGVTLTFTAPQYHRFYTGASGVINKLSEGMTYWDPDVVSDTFLGTTVISGYESITTYTTETVNPDGSITENLESTVNASVPGLDTLSLAPTITNGKVTLQPGIITFSEQITSDAADTNDKAFFAYGKEAILKAQDVEIILSNLKVELTKPITYTTSGVDDSATIAVADREGTIQNVSTINGIGVGVNNTDTVDGAITSATKIVMDNNVAGHMRVGDIVTGVGIPNSSTITVAALNPDGDNVKEFSVSESVTIADGITLTFKPQSLPVITSSTADGAGSWTVDVAQILESGSILTVDNTSRTATISGDIEIISCNSASFTLYIDIDNFLSAS